MSMRSTSEATDHDSRRYESRISGVAARTPLMNTREHESLVHHSFWLPLVYHQKRWWHRQKRLQSARKAPYGDRQPFAAEHHVTSTLKASLVSHPVHPKLGRQDSPDQVAARRLVKHSLERPRRKWMTLMDGLEQTASTSQCRDALFHLQNQSGAKFQISSTVNKALTNRHKDCIDVDAICVQNWRRVDVVEVRPQ